MTGTPVIKELTRKTLRGFRVANVFLAVSNLMISLLTWSMQSRIQDPNIEDGAFA